VSNRRQRRARRRCPRSRPGAASLKQSFHESLLPGGLTCPLPPATEPDYEHDSDRANDSNVASASATTMGSDNARAAGDGGIRWRQVQSCSEDARIRETLIRVVPSGDPVGFLDPADRHCAERLFEQSMPRSFDPSASIQPCTCRANGERVTEILTFSRREVVERGARPAESKSPHHRRALSSSGQSVLPHKTNRGRGGSQAAVDSVTLASPRDKIAHVKHAGSADRHAAGRSARR